MNKETIYIESSDDITDILSKLKSSDKKVIALVPPKKPSVLLSAVNIKLIARTAKTEGKAVVLVTTDDSLTKLAMSANLPVAPSLKSRPVMPDSAPETPAEPETKEPEEDEKEEPEEPEESEDEEETSEEKDEDEDNEDEKEEKDEEESEEEDKKDDEKDDKKSKKKEKKAKKEKKESSNPVVAWISNHKLIVIIGVLLVAGIVAFLIWALTIAQDVKVSISVRTTAANFSENVLFVKQPADEDVAAGKFYIREEKVEKSQTVKFTATGKKDIGETATGTITVAAYFKSPNSVYVPAGTRFSNNGLDYVSKEDVTISGPADMTPNAFKAVCVNYDDDFNFTSDSCRVEATIEIKAAAPGEDYNISATNEGWSSSSSAVAIIGSQGVSGGTSDIVTVVQQSDVDLALEKIKTEKSTDNKNELYVKLSDSVMPIDASFKVSTSDPKITPAVGEEVKDGVTPEISTKTTYTVYTVDKVRIEEFIKQKAKLDSKEKLYSVGDPYVEYFTESDDNYSAKLKTAYKYGPEISETEVLEKIQGEKIGRIEPILKDAFPGISSAKVEKSYFWVNSVSKNPNKVQIELTVEE